MGTSSAHTRIMQSSNEMSRRARLEAPRLRASLSCSSRLGALCLGMVGTRGGLCVRGEPEPVSPVSEPEPVSMSAPELTEPEAASREPEREAGREPEGEPESESGSKSEPEPVPESESETWARAEASRERGSNGGRAAHGRGLGGSRAGAWSTPGRGARARGAAGPGARAHQPSLVDRHRPRARS